MLNDFFPFGRESETLTFSLYCALVEQKNVLERVDGKQERRKISRHDFMMMSVIFQYFHSKIFKLYFQVQG